MIIRAYLTKADADANKLTDINTDHVMQVNADDYSILYSTGFGEHFDCDYFAKFIMQLVGTCNELDNHIRLHRYGITTTKQKMAQINASSFLNAPQKDKK